MIRVVLAANVTARRLEVVIDAAGKLFAQARQSPFFNQKGETAFRARIAWSVVTEYANQGRYQLCCLRNPDEHIEWRCNGESTRPHLATNEYVEADLVATDGRHQR